MPFYNSGRHITLDEWLIAQNKQLKEGQYVTSDLAQDALNFIAEELRKHWERFQRKKRTENCCDKFFRRIFGDTDAGMFIDDALLKAIFKISGTPPTQQHFNIITRDGSKETFYFNIAYNNFGRIGILTPSYQVSQERKDRGRRELTGSEIFALLDD